ncbi:hypothetical protein GN809_24540, partial [Escherichia coli]|nr:hypothetical protein [Escherichia coli]
PKTSIICSPMTSLKTSIKTITYLSDIGCLEIQGASLKIKPSEWCEQYTVFPDGPLAQQKTKLFSFQVEPLNATVDPSVQKICLMSSAQLLKTTILQNAMLYRMANKPSHMIFAGSSGSTVKKFRTGKWMDTINACPNLQALITDKSDKNAVNDLHTQQNVDVTNGAIVIHTQRLKSDPGGNLLS